jgi:hypothetical protein
MENSTVQSLEKTATSALSAASKSPFKTAFKITFGIGLAHVALVLTFFAGLTVIGLVGLLLLSLGVK